MIKGCTLFIFDVRKNSQANEIKEWLSFKTAFVVREAQHQLISHITCV